MVFNQVLGAERMSPRDAEFIYNEAPGHRSQMMAMYFFDVAGVSGDGLSRAAVLDWMAARLDTAEFFTRRIQRVPMALDYPHWVTAAPDLDWHVHTVAASKAGWVAVEDYLAPVLAQPMDLSRPPWELHVLTGVTGVPDLPEEVVVVALKVHHSAGDGLSIRDTTLKLFGADATEPGSQGGVANSPPHGDVGSWGVSQSIGLAARAALGVPANLVRFGWGLRVTGAAAQRVAAAENVGELEPVAGRSNTRVNGTLSGAVGLQRVRFDRAGVRALRQAVPGATVNDVYLGIVGRALAEYLAESGAEPTCTLVALAPRSMRGRRDGGSANMLDLLKIDTHSEITDPIERIRAIAGSAAEAKRRSDHDAVRKHHERIDTAPAALLQLVGRVRRLNSLAPDGRRESHSMISNIPLVVDGREFLSAPAVLGLGTQPPVDGDCARHFLTAAVDGGFELCVASDAAAIEDPVRYCAVLVQVFSEMAAAARSSAGESD